MIDLLYDMHLAVGTTNLRNKENEKDRNYMSLVYEKYGIDSTRFAVSNIYYTSQAIEYEEMFEEVERRLELLHEEYESERDSAINASQRKERLPLDSIKRVDEIEY
jgi:protein-tyrosine-phosphatase